MIDLIKLKGPPSLQRKLRALCEENSDIFDTTVRAESADVPPMSIKIDETKWKSYKHRLPPRTHSVEKQSQIRQQYDELPELRVIRHSTANKWSLVHMVPKPTPGEWRFTLDFVRLNDCTSDVLEEETKKSERLVRDREPDAREPIFRIEMAPSPR